MARTGLYKSEVKNARDSLLSQGKHPSVDAVRVALGNTGSKTTIHKYLKELQEDDGGQQVTVTLSSALQNLVGQLAAQLQADADVQISAARSTAEESRTRLKVEIERLRQTNVDLVAQLAETQTTAAAEKAAHEQTAVELKEHSTAEFGLQVQVSALKERLEENEQHRRSLEEKHQHAREALEHYRASAKDQRDQDIRRHEQEVQVLQAELRQLRQDLVLKQDDVTRLNKEGVRLVSELTHTKQALYDQQMQGRQLVQRLEILPSLEARNAILMRQVSEHDDHTREWKTREASMTERLSEAEKSFEAKQMEAIALKAKLETTEAISGELRAFLQQPSG